MLHIPLFPPSLLHTCRTSSRQHSLVALQQLAGLLQLGHGGALAELCLPAGQHAQLVAWLNGQGAAGQHVAKDHGYAKVQGEHAAVRLFGVKDMPL